jgi:hypothetical protein
VSKITQTIEAGLLMRRQLRRFLDRQAFLAPKGLRITYHEDRGWLSSTFTIRVEGDAVAVYAWWLATNPLLEEVADGT